ncbi:hypothetical protein SDRG_05991 [Saprolegnia diclina VS20]|uniref:Uncharacterized protein n=1 Tax=Saprolegnia diclina (strain VS20) TaxID=1156394 RepID=T0S1K9_SAPDV|nr:hypothetical protein SDRG_05991 [Saprolegnia diclina VS20]EQC36542.1 hypothetical protein SDRG_05991 [Saprolegnia diclina VS20]|eukprot:XP_008609963.1 hypothetical protein SDRG_05991 [Saprolegnia diclina VS20]
MAAPHPYECEIVLDFASAEAATYAYETLNVDDEISPEKITKQLSTNGHQLIAHFWACEIRMLRAAASSFYDMALVTSRVLLEFDGLDE